MAKHAASSNPTPSSESAPWYDDGLRFKCTGCGDCCTGAPGYVWVNQAEIDAMAARLQMDVGEFEQHYVRRIGIRRSLKELANYDCVFLDAQTRKCRVYEDRPRQCRTWPFWNSNLRTPQSWNATCDVCPGSGRGRLYTLGQIERQAAEIDV